MDGVRIRGGGVAAACCAHLLRRSAVPVCGEAAERPRVPAVLLGGAAQQLIADVFEAPGVFAGLYPITQRIVAWGKAETVVLPHEAVVISEEQLLARLPAVGVDPVDAEWTVVSSGAVEVERFGAREAAAIPVELSEDAEANACWIESTECGWLFLIASEPGRGWLIAVGELGETRLIGRKVKRWGEASGRFATAPRIARELCGAGWLGCGSAAMGFDPLCGDGTAHAVREAILASAVICAVRDGEDRDAVLAHYRARLIAAFHRHLTVCRSYYASGGAGEWWEREVRATEAGIAWCEARMARGFGYRLEGFGLKRV